MHLACRSALASRGVAHVTIPVDIQSQPMSSASRSKRNVPGHASELFAIGAKVPGEDQVAKAAAILNEGKRIFILAGAGALHASEELAAVAERLVAPVGKALLGKAALPDDSPYSTGGVGLLGTRPSQDAIESCDTFLIVGSSFPYLEYYPQPGQARCVQIDIDPHRIGLRYPVDAALVGDAARSLAALLPRLDHHTDRSFLEGAQAEARKWTELMHERIWLEAETLSSAQKRLLSATLERHPAVARAYRRIERSLVARADDEPAIIS